MAQSQNGYTVFPDRSTIGTSQWPRLRFYNLPGTSMTFLLRDGSPGFLLMHLVLWHHEEIESVTQPWTTDDFGYSPRQIAGSSTWSNHASGTAVDLNSLQHPQGQRDTYGPKAEERLIFRTEEYFDGLIRWGGTFRTTVDEMHYEINDSLAPVETRARQLLDSPRGERICEANPGLRKIVLS